MRKHAPFGGKLGVAGNFPLPYLNVVASRQFSFDAQLVQRFYDRLRELAVVVKGVPVVIGDKAEIEIAWGRLCFDCR